MRKCPKCKLGVNPAWNFCPNCGFTLSKKYPIPIKETQND